MKIRKSLVLSSLLATLLLTAGISGVQSFALRTLSKGDLVNDSEVTLMDGSRARLSELSGEKGLLMIFWATWSERSMGLLKYAGSKLTEKYEGEGIKILALNVEHESISSENMDEIKEAFQGLGTSLSSAVDLELSIFNEFGVISVPTSVLIGRDMIAKDAYPGFPSVAKDEIPGMLNSYLGIKEEKPAEATHYLLAKKPQNRALLYYNLGKNLYKRYLSLKGELHHVPKRVIGKLDESIKRDPDFYAPYMLKAIIYHKAGKEEEQKEALEIIDGKGFDETTEQRDLAYMYIILGKLENAHRLMEELKEDIPEDPSVILLAGIVEYLGETGEKEKAYSLFKGASLKGENYPWLEMFIDAETGKFLDPENPEKSIERISEKVLNISKK